MLILPEYPWTALAPYTAKAAEHPDGASEPVHRDPGGPHAADRH